ncbi:MAG: hypothetical protein IKX23_01520 [Treponema sp.]|nr:hypothetical protein [Treponema sp.]
MDNGNKIAKDLTPAQRHKDVLLFLNEELNNIQTRTSSVNTYDLEKEYAKTKKHKSPFAALVLIVCAAAVFGAAYLMSVIINKNNEKIEVNLEEFEDLNLRDLLNNVSKVQVNYDNAVKEKILLESQMQSEIQEAEAEKENELFVIDSLNLRSQSQINQRKWAVENAYNKKVREIKSSYEQKITTLELEIDNYKKELDSYDAAMLESAKEQEQALNSQRKVQEMEIERITKMYEDRITELQNTISNDRNAKGKNVRNAVGEVAGRYKTELNNLDPVLKDSKADSIIDNAKNKNAQVMNARTFAGDNNISNETVISNISEYQAIYDDYKYLKKPVSSLPQKNSIPEYVNTMDMLVDQMSQTFLSTLNELNNDNLNLKAEIAKLNENVKNLNQEKEALNQRIASLGTTYKNRLDIYTDCISELILYTPFNAVVVTATDKDNITIYVAPKARYLVTENGTPVEIVGLENVRGKIYPFGQDYFLFMPELDAEGNPVNFNLSNVKPGAQVKILQK